jgi:membrane protein
MDDASPAPARRPLPAWLRKLPRASLDAATWAAAGSGALVWLRRKLGPDDAPTPAPPLTPEECDAAEPGRGRAATAPWSIPARGWKDILWRAAQDAGRNRLATMAGGVTFFLLLATFPALAAFVSVYGLFLNLETIEMQLGQLSAVFPQEVVTLIGGQMMRLASQRHETLSATLVFSALASVWSANAGMKALVDALNIVYGESEKRPWFTRTLATYAATLVSVGFLVAAAMLTVAAPMLLHAIGLAHIHVWLTPLRWLVLYLMATCAFSIAYRHGPSRAPARWRWVMFGGAICALAWMVGSLAFSGFLDNFGHFGATYGSLGAMIGFMLWIWFTVMVILLGAELNAEIEHQTAQDTTVSGGAPLAAMADNIGAAFTVSLREIGQAGRRLLGRYADMAARLIR